MRGGQPLAALLGITLLLATTSLRAQDEKPKPKAPSRPTLPACTDTLATGPDKPEVSSDTKSNDKDWAAALDEAPKARDREGEACKKDLDAARESLVTKEKAVADLVKDKKPASEIVAAEKAIPAARAKYLETLDACGPCFINRVKQVKIITPEKTEIWYESLGTCLIPPKKAGEGVYDRIVKYLSSVENYPAYSKKGLRNILEFVGVDAKTGAARPDYKNFEKPFPLFIAVLGPSFFGETFAPSYFIENTIKSDKAPWNLEFNTVPEIKAFKGKDKVVVHSASGKTTATRPLGLKNVMGQWCVRKKGFSYFTAADFGGLGAVKGFTTDLAKSVLLETLAHLYEIGLEEKP